MVATLFWMVGCATNEAPSSSQRESPAEDPRAEAAALDARTPLPLTPQMAEHQKVQMRDHLVAVSEITAGLAASDWAGVEAAGCPALQADGISGRGRFVGAHSSIGVLQVEGAPAFREWARDIWGCGAALGPFPECWDRHGGALRPPS